MKEKPVNPLHDGFDFGALLPSHAARLNVPVTIYQGIQAVPANHITLHALLSEIRSSDMKRLAATQQMVEAYEIYLEDVTKGHPDPKKNYAALKESLLGFSIGKFSYRKNEKECILEYVPCLVFDLDGCISTYQTFEFLHKLKELPYIFAAFPSPSGYGLRIMVWTTATYETHRILYGSILTSLGTFLGITTNKNEGVHLDSACQNESRFFYYTAIAPKEFYLNLESTVYVMPPTQAFFGKEKQQPNGFIDATDLMARLDENLKGSFSGRNERLFHLAMRFKNNDILLTDAENYGLTFVESDFGMKEILTTIRSAYKIAKAQFSEEQKRHFLAEKEIHSASNEAQQREIISHQSDMDSNLLENGQNPPKTIEAYRQMRRSNQKSKSNNAQIKKFLLHHYQFRRNIVANTIEYCVKKWEIWETLREYDLIDELLDEGFKSVEQSLTAFLGSSQVIDYDPFIGYFESLPAWNGVDYIRNLANYVKTDDKMWWYTMFKKALVRNCACAIGHVNYNKQCIVLFGGTNTGKSKFIRFLVPPVLKKYLNENPNIGNKDDKDARLSIAKNFISNLDEIGNATERELKEMKSTFSKESVNERLIYDKSNSTMARKTTFWGSTDKDEFLIDEQGNVRWVVIQLKSILHDDGGEKGYNQNINIDNVWGQAYHLLKNGFKFILTPEEMDYSEKNNRDNHMKTTLEEELLLRYFIPATRNNENAQFFTTTDIMLQLDHFSKKTTLRNVGIALKKLGYEKENTTLNGRKVKGYFAYFVNDKI
jgi:hypothetical protein